MHPHVHGLSGQHRSLTLTKIIGLEGGLNPDPSSAQLAVSYELEAVIYSLLNQLFQRHRAFLVLCTMRSDSG